MTGEAPDLISARIEAERAREQLMGTAHRLQARISPGNLAHNAWQGAKDKGADLAETAVDVVRNRPLAATGVVAALTLFLAREPLLDLAGRLTKRVTGKKRKTKTKSTETVE